MSQKKKLTVDVAVIGGGPGGYTAAFRSADLGGRVALIEADQQLGGTCLLRGCIPSKMLLHVMSVLQESQRLKDWGVHFEKPRVDLSHLRASKNKIIGQLSQGIEGLRKKRKVILVNGFASFLSSQSLAIEGDESYCQVDAKKVIIASGSKPVAFSAPFMNDKVKKFFMDSTGALDLENIPPRLLVVGGGVIALELGQVYAELGSEVVVIELAETLLPNIDSDLVRPLKKKLNHCFQKIHTGTKIIDIVSQGHCVDVTLQSQQGTQIQSFDKILCAIGRKPFVDALHIEQTGVQTDDRGFIEVNKKQETKDPHIFAIGDITHGPMLAHKAIAEAKIASENIAGMDAHFDFAVVPNVIYTDPEIAWCGLTEKEARQQDIEFSVGKFPWSASGRNLVSGGTDGLSKVIVSPKTGRVLGVGIVGKHAGELISEASLAIEMGATVEDLSLTIHPHPTLSESLSGASEQFLKIATDI